MGDPLFILVVLAVIAVVVVLVVGVGGFGKGGAFNAKHGNRLMRWRIGLQAVAVVLIVLYVYLRQAGGQ
jgi:hypothetical protein